MYNIYYYSDDGDGTYISDDDYTRATDNNYNYCSCGYTSYEEEYGYYKNAYDDNHCETEYGGYYNEYVRANADGYETNDPPTEKDEMCGISEHTANIATVLKEKR